MPAMAEEIEECWLSEDGVGNEGEDVEGMFF